MKLFRRTVSHKPKLFVFPSIGGPAPYFWSLKEALESDFELVKLERTERSGQYLSTPDEVRQSHLDQIKASQPSGPYYLIGHSYGSQVAFFTAVALQDAGEDVAFVGIIDDEADVHRRRFNINATPCDKDDPVASGRHVVDLNPLYRFRGKLTLFRADIWSGTRSPGPACDWDFLADGGVDVFGQPFTHTSIISAPAVDVWAPQLRNALSFAAGTGANHPGVVSPIFHPSRTHDVPDPALQAYRASKAGDLAGEIEGYRRALASNTKVPDWIAINLAAALRQNNQVDEAISVLRSFSQGRSSPGNVHFELISIFNATGRHAERTRLADEITAMRCSASSDYHFKGILLEVSQKHPESIEAFRRAIDLCADRSDSRYRCAHLLLQSGRFGEAQEMVEEGLRLEPNSGFMRTLLGEVLLASGAIDEAEATLRRVVETDLSMVRAVLSLSRLLIDAKRLVEARGVIDEALTRHTSNHWLCMIDAELRLSMGQLKDAETTFRRAIALQNQSPHAWIGLAKLMASDGRPEEALDLLRSAPQLIQQNGAVRMQAGDIALAIKNS